MIDMLGEASREKAPHDRPQMQRILGHLLSVLPVLVGVIVVTVSMLPALIILIGVLVFFLPLLVSCAYISSTAMHWLYADHIRWGPMRVFRVSYAVFEAATAVLHVPFDHQPLKHVIQLLYRTYISRSADIFKSTVRNVQYNEGCLLDLYLPEMCENAPVVVFIYGGAWNSGAKELYAPVGWHMAQQGYICIVPNYRTYPSGLTCTMASDVADSLNWASSKISEYGGNPQKISAIGHSAGAHILLLALLFGSLGPAAMDIDYLSLLRKSGYITKHSIIDTWFFEKREFKLPAMGITVPKLHACVLLSGVYNAVHQFDFERNRGVEELSGLRRANGVSLWNLMLHSPTVLLSGLKNTKDASEMLQAKMPRILLVHGAQDDSVPCTQSVSLHAVLHTLVSADLRLPDGHTHVRPLADLMHNSVLCHDVLCFLNK